MVIDVQNAMVIDDSVQNAVVIDALRTPWQGAVVCLLGGSPKNS